MLQLCMLYAIILLLLMVPAVGICPAAVELQGGSNFELLLKEATEAYKMGDYNRALALCHPVRLCCSWDLGWWLYSGPNHHSSSASNTSRTSSSLPPYRSSAAHDS